MSKTPTHSKAATLKRAALKAEKVKHEAAKKAAKVAHLKVEAPKSKKK